MICHDLLLYNDLYMCVVPVWSLASIWDFFVCLFLSPKPNLYYKDTKTVDTIYLCVPGMPTFRD